MRRLVIGTFLTLDGIMQGPGGPEEDTSGGFTHGGWTVPYFDDRMGQAMDEWIRRLDALVLGRKTYEIFAAHWPRVSGDPVSDRFNRVPKYVASRTLTKAEWNPSTIIKDDLPGTIRKLKNEGSGELQVHGSGNLIQTLLRHELIDELRFWIFPVVLGSGKRLFADGTVPAALTLAEHQTSSTGVMLHVYQPAGKPSYGSFALEEPQAAGS